MSSASSTTKRPQASFPKLHIQPPTFPFSGPNVDSALPFLPLKQSLPARHASHLAKCAQIQHPVCTHAQTQPFRIKAITALARLIADTSTLASLPPLELCSSTGPVSGFAPPRRNEHRTPSLSDESYSYTRRTAILIFPPVRSRTHSLPSIAFSGFARGS